MHVRCDKQYKTGADSENILGQPMLFECMGICVLSPMHRFHHGSLCLSEITHLAFLFRKGHSVVTLVR